MARKFLFALMVVALALAGCKPVSFYLQQVDKVYGRVTDSVTGTPLESVEVLIHGYQYSELTNGLGDYEIEMSEGTWTLDFVKDGYITYSQVVTCGPAAPRQKVDVQLVPVALPVPWIVGDWVEQRPYGPFCDLITFGSDGITNHYDDVYGEQLLMAFTWLLNGDALTLTSLDGTVKLDLTVTKYSNDEFTLSMSGGNNHFYRKIPGDNIFTKQETGLTTTPTAVTVESNTLKLCSFTASNAGVYDVSWTVDTGGATFHGYQTDQRTMVFEIESSGITHQTVALEANQKIFIIIGSRAAATFNLWVQPPG